MRIIYNDLVQTKTLFSSGERVGYPASNVQHRHLSRVWRSLSSSAQYLTFDAGVGNMILADTAVIVAHNLTAAAGAKAQGNDSDSWVTPPVDNSGDPLQPIIIIPFPQSSRRFWHFSFDDPSNPAGYIQIGRVMFCLRWDSVEQIDTGLKRKPQDSSRSTLSASGQIFTDIGIRSRVYSISLGTMKDETRASLELISSTVRMDEPVILLPEDSGKMEPIYCTMETIPGFTNVSGWLWNDDGLQFKKAF